MGPLHPITHVVPTLWAAVSKVGNTYAKGWFLCDQPFAGKWHLSGVSGGYNVKGWQCKNQPLTKRPPTFCSLRKSWSYIPVFFLLVQEGEVSRVQGMDLRHLDCGAANSRGSPGANAAVDGAVGWAAAHNQVWRLAGHGTTTSQYAARWLAETLSAPLKGPRRFRSPSRYQHISVTELQPVF